MIELELENLMEIMRDKMLSKYPDEGKEVNDLIRGLVDTVCKHTRQLILHNANGNSSVVMHDILTDGDEIKVLIHPK